MQGHLALEAVCGLEKMKCSGILEKRDMCYFGHALEKNSSLPEVGGVKSQVTGAGFITLTKMEILLATTDSLNSFFARWYTGWIDYV